MTSRRVLTSHAGCPASPATPACGSAPGPTWAATERSAYGIVTDLTAAGYVAKQKDGRRNRYQIQADLPLPEPASQEPAIGDVLALLAGAGARLHHPDRTGRRPPHPHPELRDGPDLRVLPGRAFPGVPISPDA